MSSVLFLCEGVPAPAEWRGQWPTTDRLDTEGARSSVNFAIRNPEKVFLGSLDGRALDLIRIGAFALAADQSVSRGGDADPRLRSWHRRLGLVLPVNDPDFWGDSKVLTALRECLGFLSDDEWDFRFVPARETRDRQLALGESVVVSDGEAEVVIPFSGGVDSLTAAVEELQAGRRPLLISHSSSTVPEAARLKLLDGLRGLFPARDIGRVSAKVNRIGAEAVERTSRSRSFLFASIAVAAATQRGARDVLLPDNGWASVNPRINDQLVGALATRSTHPRFLRLFNELTRLAFDAAPEIRNPFWDRTRVDVLDRLREAGGVPLLGVTRSCAAGRNLPAATPHCGRCSQCIDRRFASEAAELTEHDPRETYAFDIFAGDLAPMTKLLVLSYVRAARKIHRLSDDGLFEEFPELIDCLGPTDGEDEAYRYVTMFRRQAEFVLCVIELHLAAAVPRLARGEIPPNSLVDVLTAEQGPVDEFRQSAGYASVTWREQGFVFTRSQAVVIQNLHAAHERGLPSLGSAPALEGSGRESSRMSDVFKRHPAWNSLVVRVGKSTYRLALSPKVAQSSPSVA